jgi:hypothetical protein
MTPDTARNAAFHLQLAVDHFKRFAILAEEGLDRPVNLTLAANNLELALNDLGLTMNVRPKSEPSLAAFEDFMMGR